MTNIHHWIVRRDWRTGQRTNRLIGKKNGLRFSNQEKFEIGTTPYFQTMPVGHYGNPVFPSGILKPKLFMPKRNFAPDYLSYGGTNFVSRRLRDVMALPESDVQYIDIELLDGSPKAFANDYRWMNILACHPAIDLQQSIYETDEATRATTGETFRFIWSYNRMVIRDDIDPDAHLFRVAEDLTTVLASDALAERVMRAGCTGIAFEDPATYFNGPIHRYRTAAGIEEEDMNKIFPEAP